MTVSLLFIVSRRKVSGRIEEALLSWTSANSPTVTSHLFHLPYVKADLNVFQYNINFLWNFSRALWIKGTRAPDKLQKCFTNQKTVQYFKGPVGVKISCL